MATFDIQIRLNTQFDGEPIKRGQWDTIASYETFQQAIDAWDQYRHRNYKYKAEWKGKMCEFSYQYRPFHNFS